MIRHKIISHLLANAASKLRIIEGAEQTVIVSMAGPETDAVNQAIADHNIETLIRLTPAPKPAKEPKVLAIRYIGPNPAPKVQ